MHAESQAFFSHAVAVVVSPWFYGRFTYHYCLIFDHYEQFVIVFVSVDVAAASAATVIIVVVVVVGHT